MLVTNLNQAVGNALWRARMTREQFSVAMGVSQSSLSRMLHNDFLSRQLMNGLDAIGYDVEIRIVPKVDADE